MCRDDAATSATSATCQVRSGTLHLLKKMLSPSPKKRPRAQKGCKAGRGIWENMGSLGFTYTKRCGQWMKMVMFHIYVSSQDGNPDGKNPFLGTWDVPSRSCIEPPQHLLHGSSMFFTVFAPRSSMPRNAKKGRPSNFFKMAPGAVEPW